MYAEEELLPISALQHFVFCPRQCALIHVEKLWVENVLTYQGQYLHRNVHEKGHEKRKEQMKEKSLQIASYAYGIFGEADMVEFYKDGTVHIVEHKRGKPKTHQADEIQLCAQAICLEEMLEKKIDYGFLFYNETKRREKIIFDDAIRKTTVKTIHDLRDMIANKYTPKGSYKASCKSCSFFEICIPKIFDKKSVKTYIKNNIV